MICPPCRQPHHPDDCVDALAGRTRTHRACSCQHKPVGTATPAPPLEQACQCEHKDHEAPATQAHAYLQVPAGTHRAAHVGPICDDCARDHLADYLTDQDQ